MSVTGPTTERILQLTAAAQATALVGAAVEHALFTRLESAAMTADELAQAASISLRGARALLDGLVALNIVFVNADRYSNSPDASAFLVEGKASSLTGLARIALHGMSDWAKLPEAVASGAPVIAPPSHGNDPPASRALASATAPLTRICAESVATQLDVARRGPLSILDVGGGSGVFSAVLLQANAQARATQLDWPAVNAVARKAVDALGVGERFRTLDGDFHTADWGAGYDVAIFSNLAQQESAAQNVEAFRKFRRALKAGGALVISDIVAKDDRSGTQPALLLSSRMLLTTKEGASWRVADYRNWLTEAGFTQIVFAPTAGASTVIYARA